jgi:hypothetical protein
MLLLTMPDRVRQLILGVAGVAALVFALWPPGVDYPYLGVAAALLGIEPLAQGYSKAPDAPERRSEAR